MQLEWDAAGPFVDCVQMNLSAPAAPPCMSEAVQRSSSAERRVGSGVEAGSGESWGERGVVSRRPGEAEAARLARCDQCSRWGRSPRRYKWILLPFSVWGGKRGG